MQRRNIFIEAPSKEARVKITDLFNNDDLTLERISGNTAFEDENRVVVNACFPSGWDTQQIESRIERILQYYSCQWEEVSAE